MLVKAAALLVTLGLLGVALVITVIAAAPLVDLRVETAGLAAAVLSQVLLAALYGALALGLGAATGRHGLAIGVSTAVAVAAYLVRSLGALTDASEWIQRISPVYWAVGNDPMLNGVGTGLIAVAAAIGVVVGASTKAFADRDLHV
jgi:beta-exotoxin I transport system permease protein